MLYLEYIEPELLVLVPVLYFLGAIFKRSRYIKDRQIPLLLGLFGVSLAMTWTVADSGGESLQSGLMAGFTGFTQGVLCAGASVYLNQLIKQSDRDKPKK